MTHHGPDYDRQKWGKIAKWVLKTGEYIGARYSNEVIVISDVIQKIVNDRCNRSSQLICNGVPMPSKSASNGYLDHIGVSPGNYILAVARFVPEKGLHDLIQAFYGIERSLKLVIAGDADHDTEYSRGLKALADRNDRIIMTGYVTGEYLNQLYSHARLFVLPSYHEGLPISLLEAMSYGVPPLVSDIPANKEVCLDSKCYFSCGDVENLKTQMNSLLTHNIDPEEQRRFQKMVAEKYNWDKIAKQTIDVYKRLLKKKNN
jgi:glycosyltransferase involved in cell wall biosynthesis